MADLTTLLSKFLNDIYAGTVGVTFPLQSITFTTTGTINGPAASLNILGATSQTVRIGNADGVPLTVGGSSVALSTKIASYNNVTTAGWGVPAVYAAGRATAQAAANASVATYTVGVADGSFEVSANVLVTTATTHAFTVTCAYTDEGNTARTLTLPFTLVAGSAIVNSVANANGAVPYMGIPQHIRCKAATTITIATTGTFTTVAYNVEGVIKQTA